MATTTPTKPSAGPLAPPPEEFWDKYSPHYEFPLSSVGSVAMHVAAVGVFVLVMYLLAQLSFSDKVMPPMRPMTVTGADDGESEGKQGSGGGDMVENVNPHEVPMDPMRNIPQATLDNVKQEIKDFVPTIPQADDAPKIEELPAFKKIAQLNDDIRKKLLEGKSGERGKGPDNGKGTQPEDGSGTGGKGNAESSKSRGIRWELIFKTESGRDYVAQLAAMKATLVIPQPADWKTSKAYRNIGEANPVGEAFSMDNMPGLYFIDDSADSAAKVAKALGLNFAPPIFIAFFPKDVEEELAAKERAFRKRKEGDIFSTKFKILIRDGRYEIVVVDQVPIAR